MKNQCSHPRPSLMGLALTLLLGLVLAAPAIAQPAKGTETYKISNVFDARVRSTIAATGADVFEVGHDYVLVEATPAEAKALKQLASLTNAASNSSWSEGSLNAAGLAVLNKTGTTQIRVYFATDDNDDTGNDYLGYYSGDNATAANRPQLVVTYQ